MVHVYLRVRVWVCVCVRGEEWGAGGGGGSLSNYLKHIATYNAYSKTEFILVFFCFVFSFLLLYNVS